MSQFCDCLFFYLSCRMGRRSIRNDTYITSGYGRILVYWWEMNFLFIRFLNYFCVFSTATNGVPPSVSKRIKLSVDCKYKTMSTVYPQLCFVCMCIKMCGDNLSGCRPSVIVIALTLFACCYCYFNRFFFLSIFSRNFSVFLCYRKLFVRKPA